MRYAFHVTNRIPYQSMSYYRWTSETTLLLTIRVNPGAQHSAVGEVINGALQIRLNAQPVDNKANKALIDFLAKLFKTPKSHISIIAGEKARIKTVALMNPRNLPEILTIERSGDANTK